MNFKAHRMSASLTQEEAAKVLGVGRTAISMWECGDAHPRAEMLPDIARLYGCTVDELLTVDSPPGETAEQRLPPP